mmetsp:Transcript_35872/g.32267  ORF Transcript_35872/g.32267 Transcript_35872/m.32267 type:complete len:129 (+) Transcript_35872:310-696(+)
MVLLHGYGGSSVLYYPMAKKLAERYQVYCIDFLGMGLSSRPEFKHKTTEDTISFFIDSIEEWRKAVGINEPFYLGGHSFGGYMAGQFAVKYTDRVKKLLLLSPVGVSIPQDDEKTMEDIKNSLPFFRR